MRNKILFLIMSAISIVSCSKSSNDGSGTGGVTVIAAAAVPASVMSSFTSSFSGATETEWQHNSSSRFTAQFNLGSQRHDVGFDDNGHQSSHSIICISDPVPQAVIDAFRQNFPTDNVYEWNLRTDGTWKAHFMRGSIKWEATFSAGGALIKVEKA